LYVATHNTRTMSSDCQIQAYVEATAKIKADVIGICETRRSEELTAEWHTGDQVFLGKAFCNRPRTGGVGLIVRKQAVHLIESCSILSPRTAVLVLRLDKTRTLKIVQVYAPATNNTQSTEEADEELEEFFQEVERAVNMRSTFTIVQGDFNAKVGCRIRENERCIGKYGIGTRNDNGRRLITFAVSNHLHIMNTMFQKPTRRQSMAWRSPDGVIKNQIDYVLSSTKRIISDVTKRSHHGGIVNMASLARKLEAQDCSMTSNDVDQDHAGFIKKITEAVKDALEHAPSRRSTRLQSHTKHLMAVRARMIVEGRAEGGEYEMLCKEIRKSLQADCEAYRSKKLRRAAESHKSLKKAEREASLKQKVPTSLKDCSRRRTVVRAEMKEICENFYNDLYSSKVHVPEIQLRAEEEEIPAVMLDEIKNALSKMKPDGSPGNDKIKTEYLKAGGDALHKALAERFAKSLKASTIPSNCLTSATVLLRKKGDPEDLANYRPITLLSQVYKLFT
ncbi:Craniofacial development protein 2, partial [Toxocara canis]